MTSNGTEDLYVQKYITSDHTVFNSYTQAVEHAVAEKDRTSAGSYVEQFNEFYY